MATRLSLEEWRAVYIAARPYRVMTGNLNDENTYRNKSNGLRAFFIFIGNFPKPVSSRVGASGKGKTEIHTSRADL